MQCVILAGGLATRLRPITDNVPKSMVPANGKPFLEYQIELLRKSGIINIVLCIGHRCDLIKDYFRDGKKFNINITYSQEKELLGTGGALRNAYNFLDDHFFVLYGDAYLNIDYLGVMDYLKKMQCSALLTIYKNEGRFDNSNVEFINDKFVIYDKQNPTEKMNYIDYGLSILSKRIVKKYIPNNTFYDLADCYNALSKKNQLIGYEAKRRFYEIGSISGLRDFEKYIRT